MRMKSITAGLTIGAGMALFAATAPAQTYFLQSTEYTVTNKSGYGHSTPIIGQDSVGSYIVYTEYPIVNGVYGISAIYYQRVTNGQPMGAPVVVADSSENQYLEDAFVDYIVYTLSPSLNAPGDIVLYQISTAQSGTLTSTGDCLAPRTNGEYVVWQEELKTGVQLVLYQISSGVPAQTTVVAGPVPSIGDAAIGGRFIAWSQLVDGQYDVAAFDLQQGIFEAVTNTPLLNEQNVSTNGNWIAFETSSISECCGSVRSAQTRGNSGISIEAINMGAPTPTPVTVANNGFDNQRPNISGNLIEYESNVLGNYQIFLYRTDTGQTLQVTNSRYDERLNYINGNLATYVDDRSGSDQIYDSVLTFAANVSSDVRVTSTGLLYSRVTRTFDGTMTVTNISGQALTGPMQIVLTDLKAGITLANATGTFNGSPFITVPGVTTLKPGQSASVALQFSDPSNAMINAVPVVYSGSFN